MNSYKVPVIFPTLSIYGKIIQLSESVRNLGMLMDSTLSYSAHINVISKSANLYLRKYRHIRNYCSPDITRKFSSLTRLDYCCSLLYGINNTEAKHI